MDPYEHHFRTDHLLGDLKRRTVSSGVVTMAAQGAKFILNLASTIVMARLLTPGEFGVVAMVTTVTSLLSVFAAAGLSTATLQRDNITHAQVSNLFWMNVLISTLIALSLVALAPALAWFYHEPRVLGVALALSLTFPLAGSATQHLALLSRQMRFKAKAWIEVGSLIAGLLVGVVMALMKFGYWSLVGASLTTAFTGLVFTWWASDWRPQWPARGSDTMPLLRFGANLSIGNFVYSVARGTDGLIVGRFFGSDALGLYSRASVLLMRPLEQLLRPIDAVIEPALSRLQGQSERYHRTFLQVYAAIALVSFLFTGLFLALAHPLILVALGPKWEKADVIFAGFTMASLYYPLATATGWLFTSQGRGRDSLIARSIQGVLCVLAFFAGLPYGPAGIAISFSISCLLIQLPILNHIAGRTGPVSSLALWKSFFRHLPVWVVVFGVTRLVCHSIPSWAPILQVLVSSTVGLLAGTAFIWIFPPTRRTVSSMFAVLQDLRRSRDKSVKKL
jgi:O-antigen/teichoic acid export membrane protein